MKKIIVGVATAALLFTGCDLFKDDGTLNVQTMNNISIYVDGEFKTDAGENTKLILKEGTHKIKLYGVSKDGDWEYKAEQEVLVGGKVEKTITIYPTRYPTEQKNKKDEQARLEQEKQDQELLVMAKEKGCETYKDYVSAKFLKTKIQDIESALLKIEEDRKTYLKDSGYIVPNEFMELEGVSTDGKTLSVKIKNITPNILTYFTNYFYFLDENFNYIGEISTYQEDFAPVKSGETRVFKYNIVDRFKYSMNDTALRALITSKKVYLLMQPKDVYQKDQFGELKNHFRGQNIKEDMLKSLSNSNIENNKRSIADTESIISKKCTNFN